METFRTIKGLMMAVGELYNWRIQPVYENQPEPTVLVIHLGDMSEMYQCLYDQRTEILSICNIAWSADEVFRFYCASLWDAEFIVTAYIKANEFDITDTIYDKKVEKP